MAEDALIYFRAEILYFQDAQLYNGYDYKEDAPLVENPKNEDNHYKTKFKTWEKLSL